MRCKGACYDSLEPESLRLKPFSLAFPWVPLRSAARCRSQHVSSGRDLLPKFMPISLSGMYLVFDCDPGRHLQECSCNGGWDHKFLRCFRKGNVRECWQSPISFYRRVYRFWGVSDKSGAFLFLPCSHKSAFLIWQHCWTLGVWGSIFERLIYAMFRLILQKQNLPMLPRLSVFLRVKNLKEVVVSLLKLQKGLSGDAGGGIDMPLRHVFSTPAMVPTKTLFFLLSILGTVLGAKST